MLHSSQRHGRSSGLITYRRRAVVVATVILAVLVAVTAARAIQGVAGNQAARDRSAAVASASNLVLTGLLNAETGQRGFLLTSDPAYLQPYRAATAALPKNLRRLASLEASSHGSLPYVASLRALSAEKLRELSRTIVLLQSRDRAGALRLVDGNRGKRLMDAARRDVAVADAVSDRAGRAQRSATRRLMLATLFSIGILTLMLVCLLLIARKWKRLGTAGEANFRRVFDEAPIGMAVMSASGAHAGHLTQVNRELARITGHRRDALLGMDVTALTHPGDRAVAQAGLAKIRDGVESGETTERRWLHADGSALWVSASASVLAETSGERVCVIQAVDITARKHAEEGLNRLAFYDSLTELPNRTLMHDQLVRALGRALRQDQSVAVLYVDLDNFKDVNDLHGHSVGDAILVEAARRLRSCLRKSDSAARIGGDEFVVICEDVGAATSDHIDMLGRRITAALGQPLEVAGVEIRLEASTGVAVGDGSADPLALVRQADAAMYVAKTGGKARHAVADVATVTRAHRHLVIGQELRAALSRDELRLHYQPVVDLKTQRVVGVEALLRWQHPERGLLLPGEFLDVAEKRSLIVPIGEWVLRTACAQAGAWFAIWGEDAPTVAVNVTGRQLASPDFATQVRSALADGNLPPGQLVLEITERQILTVVNSARADLQRLSDADVQLSIDDFGTGYSTFAYLRNFHFDILKIDRSFVAGLGDDLTDTAIVRALLALSDSLNLKVIAEGVENKRQLGELDDLGCRFAQGFHLYRPVAEQAIDELLHAAALVA
jgi:diguanylate cyclase (GGDEF)-like protein/PAS domain S-box-containing protein